MDKKVKIMFSALLLILVVLAVFVIVSYVNVSKQLAHGDESALAQSRYRVFLGENGKYGVRSDTDEEIISPLWNKIEFLDDGRFLAENASSRSGIIDTEQNTIFPFIGESVSKPQYGLIIIRTTDGKYALLNAAGELLSAETWETCEYNDGKLSLSRGDLTIAAELGENGKLKFSDVLLKRRIFGINASVSFNAASDIPDIDYHDYEDMANLSLDYVQTLFSGEALLVSGRVAPGASSDVVAKYYLVGCTLSDIVSFEPSITADHGDCSYMCTMSISYFENNGEAAAGAQEPVKISQTFQLGFARSESGSLMLTSRN